MVYDVPIDWTGRVRFATAGGAAHDMLAERAVALRHGGHVFPACDEVPGPNTRYRVSILGIQESRPFPQSWAQCPRVQNSKSKAENI